MSSVEGKVLRDFFDSVQPGPAVQYTYISAPGAREEAA
jgi:hypothetical protein